MIVAQPGKREIRQRADGQWMVYRFDPFLMTAMQWEIVRIFKTKDEAKAFCAPRHTRLKLAA